MESYTLAFGSFHSVLCMIFVKSCLQLLFVFTAHDISLHGDTAVYVCIIIGEHLGSFQLWGITNKAAMGILVHVFCACVDQPWYFFGRNDAKAETPILRSPHVKSWLIGKDSDAGRDWGQEEKGITEDEMAGWESEWTPGDGDGQGGLACCDSWGCKKSDTTERLNWTMKNKKE